MSKQNAQRIESFLVHDGLQEVVGEEDRRYHYALFVATLGAVYVVVDLIVRSRLDEVQRVLCLILVGVVALVLTARLRPWHRRVVIDRNGPVCRIEWRFLYLLPVWSRSYDFEDRVLDVGTVTSVHSVKAEGEGAAPLGCLVFLIPFPFNLLAGAFSKPPPEGKVITFKRHSAVLMLRNRSDMNGRAIAPLSSLRVADPLLRAAGELVPESVVLPPPETAPEE